MDQRITCPKCNKPDMLPDHTQFDWCGYCAAMERFNRDSIESLPPVVKLRLDQEYAAADGGGQ